MKTHNKIFSLVFIILSVISFRPAFAYQDRNKNPLAIEHYINGILIKLIQNDNRAALAEFVLAESYDPDDPFLKTEIAECYIALGNYAQAYVKTKEALNLGLDDADTYRILALSASGLGRCDEAGKYIDKAGLLGFNEANILIVCTKISQNIEMSLKTLKKLQKKYPQNANVNSALGELYHQNKNTKKAVKYLNKSIQLAPENSNSYISLVNTYIEIERFDTAMSILNTYVQKFPWDKKVLEQYIDKLLTLNRFDSALKAINIYIKRDSLKGKAYFDLYAMKALESNEYYVALQAYLKMLEWDDTDYLSYYFAGKCYEELWCPESAAVMFRCALDLENLPDIYTDLALLWSRNDEPESLFAISQRAINEYPDSAGVWYWCGIAFRRLDYYELASHYFAQACYLQPDDIGALFSLADTRERAEYRSESIILLDSIITKLDNDSPLLLNYLGYILVDDSFNIEYGKKLIRRALDKEPKNPAYLDSYGWALFREGKTKKALKYLKNAEKFYDYDTEIQLHLGDIYYKLGKVDEARKHWWRSVQIDPDNKISWFRLKITNPE
ncbi:tetratricopeptide repeat protein [bacterium]|nr:tetratricopeptide repeat protein [bacterium]